MMKLDLKKYFNGLYSSSVAGIAELGKESWSNFAIVPVKDSFFAVASRMVLIWFDASV